MSSISMASLSLTPHFLSLPRWNSSLQCFCPSLSFSFKDWGLESSLSVKARRKSVESLVQEGDNEGETIAKKKTTKGAKRATTRTRKKASASTGGSGEEGSDLEVTSDGEGEGGVGTLLSDDDSKKTRQRTGKKATPISSGLEEDKSGKQVKRRGRKTKKKDDEDEDRGSASEVSDIEESSYLQHVDDESEGELDLGKDDDDVSQTYGWPPLVCCFGAAQHAFVPSGRPANRLIDYDIHETMKDALWTPEKFVRAPGGSAGSVAIALAKLGGKVAFMGKLGGDAFGQSMLYYMNLNNVQTRAVCIDRKRATAVSHMKVAKRGRLRMTCLRSCAEDSLSKSEINVDVLREAKMFYFNTHSLLDRNMRLSTLRALTISKQLGRVIFYDVNLPLPLWQSSDEAKSFIQQVWDLADIIEVTKQELEFLCGIKPTEEFDTKNNAKSKFVHYGPEVVKPLWHENLKILFVTNGTSKIHYYTKDYHGAVSGMEDPPLTPFSCDMSALGDGIVAALMRMLTVQPHLTNDEGYLKHSIRYAIDCGIIDQWLLSHERGFPPKEDVEEEVDPDPNGIRSITDREYRTLAPVSLL